MEDADLMMTPTLHLEDDVIVRAPPSLQRTSPGWSVAQDQQHHRARFP